MKKKEFMDELRQELSGLSEEDVDEILQDYEEHFRIGKKNNRTEAEISRSLGNPRDIADEARMELVDYGEKMTLGSSFRTLWNELVKTSKRIFRNVDKELPKVKEKVKSVFEGVEEKTKDLVNKKDSKKNRKEIRKNKRKAWKSILLILLNIFIMFWIMLSFYVVVFSLFISGISIVIAGIVMLIVGIFVLLNPTVLMMRNMAFSSLFGGVGVVCLGWLWSIGTAKLSKGLSWLVKKYINSTKRWSRK